MKSIIQNTFAQDIVNSRTLLPIRMLRNGFLATDFKKIYELSKEQSEQSIWAHNQAWTIFELSGAVENIELPIWFSKNLYEQVLTETLLPSRIDKAFKRTEPILQSDGFCYTIGHNGYTGNCWYANNAKEAIRNCVMDWGAIWDIAIAPMVLIYDNGEMGFSEKAMQIWKHNEEYSLSFLHSCKEKKINTENITDEAILLIKYATDNKNSKWRNHKRWKAFLKFNDTISEFEEISTTSQYYIDGKITENVTIAFAGRFILLKQEWGGLFGGEGDCGENLYILETEEELKDTIKKINEISNK